MAINPADHPFSRRAFLAGAGAITTAFVSPLVPGQRVPDATSPLSALAPREAYAESSAQQTFAVASDKTAVCCAVDITDKATSSTSTVNTYVKDATITLTNTYAGDNKGKSYSKTTDANGAANFDIRYLMEGFDVSKREFAEDYGPRNGCYSCDTAVSARATGYRQVDIKKAHIIGGKDGGLAIPMCRITDENRDMPYFRSVSFNGYDVQYTTATFAYAAGNDEHHELAAELYLKASGDATITFWRWRASKSNNAFPGISDSDSVNEKNGFTKLGFSNVGISDSEAAARQRRDQEDEAAMAAHETYDKAAYDDRWIRTASLSERFLQTNFDRGFNKGDYLIVCVENRGKKWPYLMSANFEQAPLEEINSGAYDSIPGLGGQDISITLPKKWPYIGNTTLSVAWLPKIPVVYEVSPLGYMMFGIGFGIGGETEDNKSPFDKANWKKVEVEEAKKQREEQNKKMDELWDSFKTDRENYLNGGQNAKNFTHKLFSSFEVSVCAQVMASLSYAADDDNGKRIMRGALHLLLAATAEAELGWNMVLLGFPIYVAFASSSSLVFSAGVGISSSWPSGDASVGDKIASFFSGIGMDWKSTQVALTLNVSIAIEAGAGVHGAVSLSGRGSAAITCYMGLYDGSAHAAKGGLPHFRVGTGIDTYFCGQFFMFKFSKKLWNWQWPELYDSWKKGDAKSAALGADDDGDRTKTTMPAAFQLSTNHTAGIDDDGDGDGDGLVENGEPGAFAITFEDLKDGLAVTDKELAGTSEFGAGSASSARAAGIDDDGDELELVVNYRPAGEGSNVETYNLVLVSTDEDDSREADETEQAQATTSNAEQTPDAAQDAQASNASEADQQGDNAEGAQNADDAVAAATNDDAETEASDSKADAGTAAASAAVAGMAALSADDEAEADEEGSTGTDDDIDNSLKYDDQGNELNFDPVGSVTEITDNRFVYNEHLNEHKDENGDFTAGIMGIGDEGALKPSANIPILENVYSDGRVRIMKLGNTHLMLRIASCCIDGEYRTRLVYQTSKGKADWSNPRSFNFDLEGLGKDISRFDVYDYDFDACQLDSNAVAIVLLSGRRVQGNDISMVQACTDSVTTVLVLTHIYGTPVISLTRSWRSFDKGAELDNNGEAYFTYAPCISSTSDPTSRSRYPYFIAGSFVYKRAKADKILSSDTPAHLAGFCLYAVCNITTLGGIEWRQWALASTTTFPMNGAPESVYAANIRSYTRRGRIFFKVGYESADGCGIFDTQFSYNYDSSASGRSKGRIGVTVNPPTHYSYIKKLYARGYGDYLGVDNNDVLCEMRGSQFAAVSAYSEQTFEGKKQIVSSLPPAFTLSADKSFIVWAENKEGIDGFDYEKAYRENSDPDDAATYEENGRYRIMASRAVTSSDGITLFTRPFALCQLSYPVDSIAAVVTDSSALRIVVSTITSLQDSTSNYYEITLPITAIATPMALTTSYSLLVPGETCDMEVTLRNDGNTQLTSVTLALQAPKDGEGTQWETLVEQEVPFGPETMLNCPGAKAQAYTDDPSCKGSDNLTFDSGFHNAFTGAQGVATQSGETPFDDTQFAKHSLVSNQGRDSLTPGGKATVKLALKVPDEWEGEKKLRVAATSLKFVNPVNGAIVEGKGAGATATTDSDGNIGAASVAAIDADAFEKVSEAFADEISVTVSIGEGNATEDGLGVNGIHAAQLLQSGDEVGPDDGSDNDSGNGSGSGSGSAGSGSNASGGSNGNGSSKDTLPALGDHAASFGAAGAIAALAGAGLMAYSRRRTQIEAEAEAATNASTAPSEDE